MLWQKPINHSFLLSIIDESRFSDVCTIMELKELDWLCKHMNNIRSSQPCMPINICTDFSKAHKFLQVSIVKDYLNNYLKTTKTIFCNKVALDVRVINDFFYLKKK